MNSNRAKTAHMNGRIRPANRADYQAYMKRPFVRLPQN